MALNAAIYLGLLRACPVPAIITAGLRNHLPWSKEGLNLAIADHLARLPKVRRLRESLPVP